MLLSVNAAQRRGIWQRSLMITGLMVTSLFKLDVNITSMLLADDSPRVVVFSFVSQGYPASPPVC